MQQRAPRVSAPSLELDAVQGGAAAQGPLSLALERVPIRQARVLVAAPVRLKRRARRSLQLLQLRRPCLLVLRLLLLAVPQRVVPQVKVRALPPAPVLQAPE